MLLEGRVIAHSYRLQYRYPKQVPRPFQVMPVPISSKAMRAMQQLMRSKKKRFLKKLTAHANPKQQMMVAHQMGIIPIPPPPRPPRPPPRLTGPPPKPLPLLLPLVDLLFATLAEALPLLVPLDAFLFFFHPPRELPRPLLPPRGFVSSWEGARTTGGAGASCETTLGQKGFFYKANAYDSRRAFKATTSGEG